MYVSTENKEKLRGFYLALKFAKSARPDLSNTESYKRLVSDIRWYYKQDNLQDKYRADYPEYKYTDYDRRFCYFLVPRMTDDERADYIKENWTHWYNPYDDGRDCTGVWFTTSLRVVPCGTNDCVIEHQSCDV